MTSMYRPASWTSRCTYCTRSCPCPVPVSITSTHFTPTRSRSRRFFLLLVVLVLSSSSSSTSSSCSRVHRFFSLTHLPFIQNPSLCLLAVWPNLAHSPGPRPSKSPSATHPVLPSLTAPARPPFIILRLCTEISPRSHRCLLRNEPPSSPPPSSAPRSACSSQPSPLHCRRCTFS